MYILLGIIVIIGGIAFYLWRVRATAETASDIVEAVDDIRAVARRDGHNRKNKVNPLDTIEDSRVAAATILAAFARMDGDYTPDQLQAIKEEFKEAFGTTEEEAIKITGQSRWLMEQSANMDEDISRLSRILRRGLETEEKKRLLSMVTRVAAVEGGRMSELQEHSLSLLSRQIA